MPLPDAARRPVTSAPHAARKRSPTCTALESNLRPRRSHHHRSGVLPDRRVREGDRQLLRRCPLARFARPLRRVLGSARRQSDPVRAVLPGVPRDRRYQPVRRRSHRPDHVPRQRAPLRRTFPRGVRAAAAAGPLRHRTRAGVHAGPAGDRPMAGLAAVPQQQVVRRAGRAVQRRCRVLRVRAAVHLVRDRLAVRGVGDRHAAHAGRPPVERWCAVHLVDAHRAGRHQGPPRRTAGRTRGGEGGRLLADPLRAHQRDARVRPGRHVHRGQGAAAGDDAAGPDRPVHGAAVPVDDPYRQVAPAPGRLGSVAGGGDHRRADLSGDRAVAGGQAEPGRARGALHRPQRRGDSGSDGDR